MLKSKLYIIVTIFIFLSSQSINANEPKDISPLVDSLVSTFPFLITDSAEQAKINVEQALLLNEGRSVKVSAFGNYCLGFYSRKKGRNRSAIKYHNKALSYYIDLDKPERQVLILNELGIVYKNLGKYEKSIETYRKGIEIAERIQSSRLADVYSNLAVVITHMGKQEQALEYLFKSYELEDDIIGKHIILLNIGISYKEIGNDSLAMNYYQKSLKMCNDNNLATYYRNDILHNIANQMIEESKFKQGLEYLHQIANYDKKENNKRDLAHSYLSLAAAYKAMKEYKTAINFYNKSIALSIETETNDQLLLAYSFLANLYETKHNYKSALIFQNKHRQLKDSLFNIDQVKNNESLLAEFDADRKEKEILLLKQEKEIQEQELIVSSYNLKINQLIRNVTIIVAVISILGILFSILFYKQKLKNEQLLALRNEEINKNEIYSLIQQQEVSAIKSVIEGRDKERQRIAQELHDGIGGNLASIKLNLGNIVDKNSDEKLKEIMGNLDDTCKEVREISHNLSSVKMNNHSFAYLVQKFLDEMLVGNNIKINLNLYPETKLDQLPNEIKIELYRIIQELMSNVIKYSKADVVDLQITRGDEYLNLMFEDNGIGFDTNIPTHGIGLKNIRSRIKKLNGTCTIESALCQWSLVNIEIPLT
ncbi:tetratricopeptide repeat-containing sensor histidine kinase [Flammeovirga pectinis]|uniref:tetratricopeptide repeat-containing sensor histidine kinase n=1 Tax=Flammeovirga pectinis TaxID=2494373 RepID=UPI001476FD64|nr:sensor histidine kinase [Flammeovirga pectinis]